jgi:hypothetical protein
MPTVITLKFVASGIHPQYAMDVAIEVIKERFPKKILLTESSFDPPLNVPERFSDGSPISVYDEIIQRAIVYQDI